MAYATPKSAHFMCVYPKNFYTQKKILYPKNVDALLMFLLGTIESVIWLQCFLIFNFSLVILLPQNLKL